jgi:hypothetical protein
MGFGLMRVLAGVALTLTLAGPPLAWGQSSTASGPPAIHFIWMGGNDCPPCVMWRRTELPKLQASPEFKTIRFTYVSKVIRSPVPPRLFLPSEVEVYKDLLDEASGGRTGSPQAALMVNGVVHDYFFGTRTAEEIEDMIQAVRTGRPADYPFPRCLKVAPRGRDCERPA